MTELRLLFWNLHRHAHAAELAVALCAELRPHFLMTAETPAEGQALLQALKGEFPQARRISGTPRVCAFALDNQLSTSSVIGGGFGEAFEIQASATLKHLVIAVHVESALWQQSPDDQGLAADQLYRFIEGAEERSGHARTIVIGDFNMDPFSPAMVDIRGLNALMTRRRAKQRTRTIRRFTRGTFYNPMWNLLGDTETPAGSYYWRKTGARGYFWHMLDQVLVRGELADSNLDVRVLTTVRGQPLLSRAGLPLAKVGSDHLPLFVRLNLLAPARSTND